MCIHHKLASRDPFDQIADIFLANCHSMTFCTIVKCRLNKFSRIHFSKVKKFSFKTQIRATFTLKKMLNTKTPNL